MMASFRVGWENEHLATYLLSRISFTAGPSTSGDDIGCDRFCTLFEASSQDGRACLYPRNSFAIQVKSSPDVVDVSHNLEYFKKLDLPYFLGVANQNRMELAIYSGEWLPIWLADKDIDLGLKLKPTQETSLNVDNYCDRDKAGCWLLKMPIEVTLSAHDSKGDRREKCRQLSARCSQIGGNIAARRSEEYIFTGRGATPPTIFAGSGSAKTFRRNLHLRLAEAFLNLRWLRDNRRSFEIAEFEAYKELYHRLLRLDPSIRDVVQASYEAVHSVI